MGNSGNVIFEAKGIRKTFGSTVALDSVDLSIRQGEIRGLIGENGSGKSTLSFIISGTYLPTSGEMFFHGKPYAPHSMIDASNKGIGIVVQEKGTVSGITVAQNIFLGKENCFRRRGIISKKLMCTEAQKALERIGATNLSASALIDQLNFQDQKLVEVAKVMHANPDILLADESTTALSQQGRDILYNIMRGMKAENKAVIFVSHDLQELLEVCDTLTVLRDGQFIKTLRCNETDETEIKQLMVGRTVSKQYYREDYGRTVSDEVVLSIKNLTTGYGPVENFNLDLHRGELVGIGGLSHCGMHELGKAIFGDSKLVDGEVIHVASNTRIRTPIEAVKKNIGYVSKDRDLEALVLEASIQDNIASAGYDLIRGRTRFLSPKKVKEYVMRQVDFLSIKCQSVMQNVQYLSGGNKQKVAFGKWVGRDAEILILDCPTRGVDVGVKAVMYSLLDQLLQSGKAVIMISEELTELIGMSDRIIILKDGKQTAEFMRSPDLKERDIINFMI